MIYYLFSHRVRSKKTLLRHLFYTLFFPILEQLRPQAHTQWILPCIFHSTPGEETMLSSSSVEGWTSCGGASNAQVAAFQPGACPTGQRRGACSPGAGRSLPHPVLMGITALGGIAPSTGNLLCLVGIPQERR